MTETRNCQNCKNSFEIVQEDFDFYQKMSVPAPTFCPECRFIRRLIWRNERMFYRRPDSLTGKEIFSEFHKDVPMQIYERDYWWSDSWDPLSYGRDYDFSRPFFEQFKDLMLAVPWPSRFGTNHVNSSYVNNCADVKNSYLCFYGTNLENSAYVIAFEYVKDGFDLYQSRHSELCYDSYMVDEAQKVSFSVNCEECHDVWFSRNLIGCQSCFGCTNLRNKSNYIFNKPVSREEYKKFMAEFNSGSFATVQAMREKAEKFWTQFPQRYTLGIKVVDCIGEHIESSKNVKYSYAIHDGENLKYCQFLDRSRDSYDHTLAGKPSSQIYEAMQVVLGADRIKFSMKCFPSIHDLEYSAVCHSSSDLFGCMGLKKKQYCILNKQYTKEEYEKLVPKIRKHMDEMPYTDKKGRVYKYGEFFPDELSPFGYNETLAQDFFPLSKEQALARGYLWRDEERREFQITKTASELPDDIKDVSDDITKETIGCAECGKAYRIIPMELDFYRRIPLPLPRLCVECRFQRRFKFVNPPKLWPRRCMCSGVTSDPSTSSGQASGVYTNEAKHFHGDQPCPNKFESSYEPGRPDIVYCEQCYQQEVV